MRAREEGMLRVSGDGPLDKSDGEVKKSQKSSVKDPAIMEALGFAEDDEGGGAGAALPADVVEEEPG